MTLRNKSRDLIYKFDDSVLWMSFLYDCDAEVEVERLDDGGLAL